VAFRWGRGEHFSETERRARLVMLTASLAAAGLFALPRSAVFAAGLSWLISSAAIQFLTQAVAATRSQGGAE
jgi:hypothetical protein